MQVQSPSLPSASKSSPGLETVVESQDDRWVVIVRYLEGSQVARTRVRSFPNYQEARRYEVDLHAGAVA